MKVLRWTLEQENIEYADLRIRQQDIGEKMQAQKGSKRNNEDIMSYAQQRKEEYEFDWTENRSVDHNPLSTEEHVIP